VILAVVLLNAVIGFLQEGRAERALEAIRHMLSPRASVIRNGERVNLAAEELVPGDMVLIETGDRVPADIRLIRAKGLQIDEAVLTGESIPVAKDTRQVPETADLGDRTSMGFSGTLVTAGQGAGVVVGTGSATEMGRIGLMLTAVQETTTPLLRQMALLGRQLTFIVLALTLAVFVFGVLVREYDPATLFMAVVSLAVAAIPEGLPAVLTITLAIGVRRMARLNALIRQLPAVETLGSVSVICTDKTGTLTRNEMTVRSVATATGMLSVSGDGYRPGGEISDQGQAPSSETASLVRELFRVAALCSDATLRKTNLGWVAEGDPMEGALLAAATTVGLDPAQERAAHQRLDLIPFEPQHRFMAVLYVDQHGETGVGVKGAPERVLDMCARQCTLRGIEPLDEAYWREKIDEIASRGERVLAIAGRPADPAQSELDHVHVESGLTLLGLVGLIDPPRPEAIAAIRECQSAGIRVKMITGDHGVTARAIAGQLGLLNASRVITGRDLDKLDDTALTRIAVDADVFARTSPEHKLRLIEKLQAQGRIVAMTGDGANDAPALRRADVGVAMGRKGTEAAKEAAAMVLADDNFASIAAAVRQGRTVYDNLKKAIVFMLPVNGGESLSVVAAILAGAAMPITPLQILWVNMVSSIGLALSLAFEPTEPDAMRRPPRPAGEPIFSRFLVWRVCLVSVLFLAGIFGTFEWALSRGRSVEEARTGAVNMLVILEIFYLFSVRYLRTPSLTRQGVIGTKAVITALVSIVLLQLGFTYAPVMNMLFDTRPVAGIDAAVAIGVGVVLLLILELEKQIIRSLRERTPVSTIGGPRPPAAASIEEGPQG
jgi:magnesium-transporting ATPase (P-type)